MPPEKEEYYEIVPTEPFSESESEREKERLEREIQELKQKIRATSSVPKSNSDLEKFTGKIVELLTNSQKLVNEVAESNKSLAAKIQTALDTMNKTNQVLSEKLTKILDYFAKASETEDEEEISPEITDSLSQLKNYLKLLIDQNKQTNQLLQSIEKHLKRNILRSAVPKIPKTKPAFTPPGLPPAPSTSKLPPLKEGELPPPPFPP